MDAGSSPDAIEQIGVRVTEIVVDERARGDHEGSQVEVRLDFDR